MSARILVVDDERALADALKDNFEFEGYSVDCAYSGGEALEHLSSKVYELMLLDVMMPDFDGFEVLETFRKKNEKTPVMFLSARSAEVDRVKGLRLGADDYVVKPFSLVELLERVKAILRRTAPLSQSEDVLLNGRVVNFSNRTVSYRGEESSMSQFEAKILVLLMREKDQVVRRSEILDQIWGAGAYPTDRTIDNYIAKLRQKLEDDSRHPVHLLTCHGEGYRWKV